MRCPSLEELPPPPARKRGWPWTEATLAIPVEMRGTHVWPRISIVTPSYNQGEFIEETIRSVLLQGYPDLEYIVIDGGSDDGTPAILGRYKPWLSSLHIGPDGGQADALAQGFERATGDILAWLNSDDNYLPGTLERVARFFASYPAVVFANGDVDLVDQDGVYLQRLYAVRPNRFLTSNTGVHGWWQQGSFWKHSAYRQAGGIDRSLHFCMDRDLFIRLTSVGPGRRIPAPPLAHFRDHERAKTSTILHINREEGEMLIQKYGVARAQDLHRPLDLLWRLWRLPTDIRKRSRETLGWEW